MSRKNWRLIVNGPGPGPASYNMALDEAISRRVREGHGSPTLRLYGWNSPSVTLGAFQRSAEADLTLCKREGIEVVRRPTGGRGILHSTEELTYSFSAPTISGTFSCTLLESYARLSAAFEHAFTLLGLSTRTISRKRTSRTGSPLCFQSASYGEITVEGKKVIGSAQKRTPGGLLQQGSIPLTLDHKLISRVFQSTGQEKDMAGLREFLPGLSLAELEQVVARAFSETFAVDLTAVEGPQESEHLLALDLIREKYFRECWTLRR